MDHRVGQLRQPFGEIDPGGDFLGASRLESAALGQNIEAATDDQQKDGCYRGRGDQRRPTFRAPRQGRQTQTFGGRQNATQSRGQNQRQTGSTPGRFQLPWGGRGRARRAGCWRLRCFETYQQSAAQKERTIGAR